MTLIASLLSIVALNAPQAGPPRVPVAVLVVAGDGATHGQSRYVQFLVDGIGREDGWVALAPPPIAAEVFQPCIDDYQPERCLRLYVKERREQIGQWPAQPPLVVVWVGGALEDEGGRPGPAQVLCIGVGDVATDAKAQSIMPWPRASGIHSATPLMEDTRAMAGCVLAAGAESGW